jgi:hypothetical protein
MFYRVLGAVLLVGSCVGCGGEPPPVAAEDRMQRVDFAAADQVAIADPAFTHFRDAVVAVRSFEAQRPTVDESNSASIEAYAAFLNQLAVVNRTAATAIAADGWSREQRQLMHRTLRFATLDQLTH